LRPVIAGRGRRRRRWRHSGVENGAEGHEVHPKAEAVLQRFGGANVVGEEESYNGSDGKCGEALFLFHGSGEGDGIPPTLANRLAATMSPHARPHAEPLLDIGP